MAPMVLAGVLPRLYPRMLQVAWDHQDAGRRVYICTAATQEMADAAGRTCSGFDGGLGTAAGGDATAC